MKIESGCGILIYSAWQGLIWYWVIEYFPVLSSNFFIAFALFVCLSVCQAKHGVKNGYSDRILKFYVWNKDENKQDKIFSFFLLNFCLEVLPFFDWCIVSL